MAQDLQINIKTTSDVPQAMDKAKGAVSSFDKQVGDIGNKFKMAFKDIALAFIAPMVIVQSVIGAISSAIEKSKQNIQEAISFAEKGESKYLRAGTINSAREVAYRKQDALDKKNAKLAAEALAEEQYKQGGFLGFGGEGDKALMQYVKEGNGFLNKVGRGANAALMFLGINSISKNEDMQAILERRASERYSKTPESMAREQEARDAMKALEDANNKKKLDELKQFANKAGPKDSEGFGNVIGVGANMAIEMAQMQIDELRRHTELLQMIATKEQQSTDFSKGDKPVAAPSRAKLLSGK